MASEVNLQELKDREKTIWDFFLSTNENQNKWIPFFIPSEPRTRRSAPAHTRSCAIRVSQTGPEQSAFYSFNLNFFLEWIISFIWVYWMVSAE